MTHESDIITSISDDLFECAIYLKNNIIGLTTSGGSDIEYKLARAKLMQDVNATRLLPDFVNHSNNEGSLTATLSGVASGSGSWEVRRKYVIDSFKPLLSYLETSGSVADEVITNGLTSYDAPAIQAVWAKALERRTSDPEGTVTAASTLLKEVCKHIIEDSGKTWSNKWTMPKLYAEASGLLNLSPSQHEEEVFKTIKGNCQSIIQSVGSLRNKGSDAHAGGRSRVPFKPRHVALTVNLAGSMALFLIETWQARTA